MTLNDSGSPGSSKLSPLTIASYMRVLPDDVVGFDREHFLQGVGRAVRLQRPDFHFAQTLAAELRLAAQRLLRHERVRTGRARVDLVVDQMMKLHDVHDADRHFAVERLTGPAIEWSVA